MSSETESDFYQPEDDLDEDEATQYIIEQSLIQYRKLKGLNPRLKLVKHASKYMFSTPHVSFSLCEFLFS